MSPTRKEYAMTYLNSFVLSVKNQQHKVLRESGGIVYLPFDSEYSLILKNLNNVRAKCRVYIDGTDVLGGQSLVLRPNETIDLERFMVDGNRSSGRKFKFVSKNSPGVQDPSSSDNGVIEVVFQREATWVYPASVTYTNSGTYFNSMHTNAYSCCTLNDMSSGEVKLGAVRSATIVPNDCFSAQVSDGATTEGSISKQAFGTTDDFVVEAYETRLRLTLHSSQTSVTVEETRTKFCSMCGIKVKRNDRFCSGCGVKL